LLPVSPMCERRRFTRRHFRSTPFSVRHFFFVSVPPKATSFFLFPTNVEKHVTANEIKVQEFLQNIRNFKPNEVKKSLFKKYVFVSSPRLWLMIIYLFFSCKTVFEASNNKKEELVMKNKREADGRRIKAKPVKAKGILAALASTCCISHHLLFSSRKACRRTSCGHSRCRRVAGGRLIFEHCGSEAQAGKGARDH